MAIQQPGTGDVHVDKLLTNLSVAYTNDDYIADRIFPQVMVDKQSDLIASYDKGDWLRDVMQPYIPGTKGARSGWKVDTSKTYFCNSWKLGKEIPFDVIANQDKPFDMFNDATVWLRQQAQLRWELEFATNFFKAGAGWQDQAVGTDFVAWDNVASSNPIKDLRTLGDKVRRKTGRKTNTWVYSKRVWDVLVDHPLIVDRLKHTSKESLTPEMLARLVGYDNTLIGDAIFVSSGEGEADVTAEIWGNHALGLHVPKRPSLMTPAAGYTFIWKPITSTPFFIRRLKNDEEEKHIVEIKSNFDMVKIDGDAGVMLDDAIS
jgi:hypothetical protein